MVCVQLQVCCFLFIGEWSALWQTTRHIGHMEAHLANMDLCIISCKSSLTVEQKWSVLYHCTVSGFALWCLTGSV